MRNPDKYIVPIFVGFILLLFGAMFLFPVKPTEHSEEWLIEYRYNGERYLYIAQGKKISDRSWKEYVTIHDSIALFRDSIITYKNKDLFGKDLKSATPKGKEDDYIVEYPRYYQNLKEGLLKEIPARNVFILTDED